MQISQRLQNLTGGESDGWDVFYKARRLVGEGHPIKELTIGEHDIRTHPRILEEMNRAALGGHTGYAMVPGVDALRDKVAARLTERTGVKTERGNVLITAGGQSALFAAHAAACDPGDRALFLDPYYATYPGTIRGVGAEPVAVQTRAEDAFQPDATLLNAAAIGARSLLVNTPNNPTGTVYSRHTLEGIARVSQEHDLWLISDEVYDTQVWEGEHLSPRALPGMKERTMVVGSMSKSHAMTGSRVGWIVAPEEMITALIELATHTTYGVPGYIQDAALFALDEGRWLEDEVAAPFQRRRKLALDILGRQNVLGVIPVQGAMYLMLDVRATGLSGNDFANRLLDERQIAVMPGESFGKAAAGHVRVAMTVEDTAFAEALTSVVSFAEEMRDAA